MTSAARVACVLFGFAAGIVAAGEPIGAAELPSCCRVPSRFGATASMAANETTIESSNAGVRVHFDGQLFAEYRTNADGRPVVWPIYGPSGLAMTRSYPVGPQRPAEVSDHPHHRSLWFAHGDVNGHDFWHDTPNDKKHPTQIAHREFLRSEVVDGVASIETANDWVSKDRLILSDRRRLRFGRLSGAEADLPIHYIDFTIELIASNGPVTFGDTKEGTFAVRVPGTMKVDAGLGGRFWNDAGQTNAEAWGRPASWVAYSGPLERAEDGQTPRTGGIVIMSDPVNFRSRCRWHARNYGLFAANPFGETDFPREKDRKKAAQGAIEIRPGNPLSLRYVTLFYAGDVTPEAVSLWYNTYFNLQAKTSVE